MFGYHDRVAWIDLGRRSVEMRPLGEEIVRDFVGGGGVGAKILSGLVDHSTDPLGPENPLIMMTGPYTATRVPSGSRYVCTFLSPLTGIYGESNCGGTFGAKLKLSGLDGIVFTGASERPVVVIVDGETIGFRDADDLWGTEVFVCNDRLKAEYGEGVTTAVIGPAGEKLVAIAGIMHDGRHTRAAGRCGVGAVMGSKRLKAVVMMGNGRTEAPLADAEGLKRATRERVPIIQEKMKMFGINGTPGSVANYDRLGNLPIKNWTQARAPEIAAAIGQPAIIEQIQVKRSGCRGCPIICSRVVQVKEGPYATDGIVEGPEYENVVALGSLQLNGDLKAVNKANELCNTLGLDTISAGGVIAFANECYEKGLLTKADTDGLELGFGKPDVVIELVRRIGNVEGNLGRLLAQGVRRAAAEIGQGAEEYAMHVKGLEPAYHDPRFSWGHAVSYPTCARGADHLASLSHAFELASSLPELGYNGPQPGRVAEGKAQYVIHLQNLMTMADSLIACKFTLLNGSTGIPVLADWYNRITGADIDVLAFQKLGERAFTLKRMINNMRGVTRKDDVLPPRWRTLRKKGEGVDLAVPPAEVMLSDYYDLRGWTEEGRPSADVVRSLGLA